MKNLKDIEVRNTQKVSTELLKMMRDTQDFGKRFFNELNYNADEIQRRINSLERKSVNVIKYTDGENILISINNRIWDGISMLSR